MKPDGEIILSLCKKGSLDHLPTANDPFSKIAILETVAGEFAFFPTGGDAKVVHHATGRHVGNAIVHHLPLVRDNGIASQLIQ